MYKTYFVKYKGVNYATCYNKLTALKEILRLISGSKATTDDELYYIEDKNGKLIFKEKSYYS